MMNEGFMMRIKIFFLYFLGFFLNACEETKSVEYYREHPEEAREKSLQCRASRKISQDCINAYKIGFPTDNDENLSIK